MNALHDHDPVPLATARDRLAEITTLFRRIRALLDHSLRVTDDLTDETPRAVIARMDQLIAAHLKVLTAEEAFNAAQNANSIDVTDLDGIRDDLGRRLDRLRAAISASGVPCQPD
jgi:hypothetical protein